MVDFEQVIREILDHETVDYTPSDMMQDVLLNYEVIAGLQQHPDVYFRLLESQISHLCEPIEVSDDGFPFPAVLRISGRMKDYHPWQRAGLREVQ
jgi:hypothetical protein